MSHILIFTACPSNRTYFLFAANILLWNLKCKSTPIMLHFKSILRLVLLRGWHNYGRIMATNPGPTAGLMTQTNSIVVILLGMWPDSDLWP